MRSPKSPIFGTKVDFFPIGTFQIPNVPNFNKFIWSKLHIKKKIIKIGATFFSRKTPNFRNKSGFFIQLEHSKSKIFEISINLFHLSFISKKKIREFFCTQKILNFRNKSGFFSNWNIPNPKFSKFQ